MTKSDIKTNTNTPPSKTDAIIEKARKLTAGFSGEASTDNTLTKAEVVKMTPKARLEFFKNGGSFSDA